MHDDHRPRLERAIAYINAHLDEPLALTDVAKVAALSAHHFHRTFQAYTGEPVGRFITRLRLERAAFMVAYERHRSITDIGLACGYSSSSNFAKAFAAWWGMSPSALRDPSPDLVARDGKLAQLYGRALDPQALYTLPASEHDAARLADITRRVRFETFAGLDMTAITSPAGYDYGSLEVVWDELLNRARALGIAAGPVDTWGIAFDSPILTAPELRRYHACVPCPADFVPPPPLFRTQIPAGRYAVFRYDGPVAGVDDLYRDIYSVWLPASSVEPDDRAAFQRYVSDYPVDGQIGMELWMKIVRRSA